jgi:hypothetical protein
MFKTRFFVAAALAGAAVVSTPALAVDSPVVGSWATEAKSDFGTFKATWTVAQSGDGYTIDVKDAPPEGGDGGGGGGPGAGGPPPTSKISDVAVSGSTLTFKREIMFGDMTINLTYTVTVDGNTMTGQTHSDFGDIPITGTRQ